MVEVGDPVVMVVIMVEVDGGMMVVVLISLLVDSVGQALVAKTYIFFKYFLTCDEDISRLC